MRDMGPLGYPPALIDTHVRVRDSLPFFGGSIEAVLPKRTILREDLPAFRGYTHKNGDVVSEQFFALMQRVAEVDHEESHKAALERSGIEEFMDGTLNSTTGLNDSTMSVNKTGGLFFKQKAFFNFSLFRSYPLRNPRTRSIRIKRLYLWQGDGFNETHFGRFCKR